MCVLVCFKPDLIIPKCFVSVNGDWGWERAPGDVVTGAVHGLEWPEDGSPGV